MSSEWVEASISEFISFRNGKSSPKRSEGGEIAVFGSNGIIGYCDKSNAEERTLIIGRVGSYCGSVYHSNEKSWVTDNAIIGTPVNKDESEFWYFLLKKLDLNSFRAGSGQPLLNQGILNSIRVQIPNRSKTREWIGKHLMLFDNKVELNRQTNQTLEQMAQAIFKSWFVNFEPVKAKIEAKQNGKDPERAAMCAISGKLDADLDQLPPDQLDQLAATAVLFPDELVESEMGLIPKGWTTGPISMFGEITIGGDWGKDEPENETLVQAVSLRGVDLEHLRATGIATRAPVRWVKKASIEKRTPNGCDVLIGGSGAGPCGRPLWFSEDIKIIFEPPVIYSNFVKRIRCKNEHQALYLDFVLWEMFNGGEIQNFINGTSVPNLNDKGLMARLTILPESKVLAVFHEVAKDWLKNLYSGQSNTLATLRDSLLPRLLSGNLPVNQFEQ